MSMLCFLPWASVTAPVTISKFEVIPFGDAIASGEIPADHADAAINVVSPYGFTDEEKRRFIPVIRAPDISLTADLTEDQLASYFEFRTRLTFGLLAARQFFTYRYANSDNVRMVIQSYTPGRLGGILIRSRRRDGAGQMIFSKGAFRVTRPEHVSAWCEIPKDFDLSVISALESAMPITDWTAISEAIRLFVGANTDSADVELHGELIDTVSAFSRLANAWDEKGTVRPFAVAAPAPELLTRVSQGPKAALPRIVSELAKQKTLREIWLSDAYILRSQVGHGRIQQGQYPAIWTVREHLLLSAVAFPIYVKKLLKAAGLYELSREDRLQDAVFDFLTTSDMFADVGADHSHPWQEMMAEAQLEVAAHAIEKWVEAGAKDTDRNPTM